MYQYASYFERMLLNRKITSIIITHLNSINNSSNIDDTAPELLAER